MSTSRRGKVRPKGSKNWSPSPRFRIPRPFGVPPTREVTLTSRAIVNLVNATAPNPFSYQYLNLTNPGIWLGGSASVVPFYTSNASAYRKFTVVGGHVKVDYANAETNIMNPFLGVSVNSLLANNAANNLAIFENPSTKTTQITAPSGGESRASLSWAWDKFGTTGFKDLGVEDAYVGLVDGSSPPTDNIYAVLGAATNGIASVIGVLATITIKFVVRFIEKQTPLN